MNLRTPFRRRGTDTVMIGQKVGAALVGTFLGILVAYGFIGPIASAMAHRAHEGPRRLKSSRWRSSQACAARRRQLRLNSRSRSSSVKYARRSTICKRT
jgi:hypothetical protein